MSTDPESEFRDPEEEKPTPETGEAEVEGPPPPTPSRPRRRELRGYRFQLGDAVGKTLTIWFQNFLPFALISLVLYIPVALFGLWYIESGGEALSTRTYTLLATILSELMGQFLVAALMFGVVERLRGRKASIGASIGRGLPRVGSVVVVAILTGAPFLVIQWAMSGRSSTGEVAAGAMIALVLVIPALIYMTMVAVAVPAAVVENPGTLGLGALGRSFRLTSGRRWAVFGSYFVIGLVLAAGGFVIGLVAFAVWGGRISEAMQGTGFFLGVTALQALLQPASATLPAVMYYQLRRDKEGVDVEEIAAVFD